MKYAQSPVHAMAIAFAILFVHSYFVLAQGGQAPQQQSGGSCKGNTLTFGCHAYIYGNTGSASSYSGRADSVFVDAQYMSKNQSLAQRLNQTGPVPFFYVNAYCEKRFGNCGGPQLSGSSVASQYGEIAQHPNSAEFFNNFNRQIEWVKQAQGKVIEIDNMDFYIEKGHKAAVIKLIQLAANAGINVLSKNVKDTEILRQPNVVGVVVEAGSGSAPEYHAAFASVGKPCAGVLMINAKNKTGNQYTSFTECDHPSRGDKSEYTKCSCTKNPGGMQIAGTPVAGQNVDIPKSVLQQAYSAPPQSNPFVQQLDSQPTGVAAAPIESPVQSYAPPQQPYTYQQPAPASTQSSPLGQRETAVKDKGTLSAESLSTLQKKPSLLDSAGEETEPVKTDETRFRDPLNDKNNSENVTPKISTIVPKPFGSARMHCMPTTMLIGTRPTVAWSCGKGATQSVGVGFDTRNFLLGSIRVAPQQTTLYAIKCYEEDVLIGSAQCVIKVRTDKSAEESFRAPVPGVYDATARKKVCFLSFCL